MTPPTPAMPSTEAGRALLSLLESQLEHRRMAGAHTTGTQDAVLAVRRMLPAIEAEARAAAPDTRALVEERDRLRVLLKEAVGLMAHGHPGYVGDRAIRTVQVNERTIDRFRAALAAAGAADERNDRDKTGGRS